VQELLAKNNNPICNQLSVIQFIRGIAEIGIFVDNITRSKVKKNVMVPIQ